MNGHDTRDYRVAVESLLFQYHGQGILALCCCYLANLRLFHDLINLFYFMK